VVDPPSAGGRVPDGAGSPDPSNGPDDEPRPLTVPLLLTRGCLRRCPLCGGGNLFRTWFTIEDRCPRCEFRLERIEGHWLGALGLNSMVSFGAVLVAVIAAFALTYGDDSPVVALVIVVSTALVVPLAFYPVSKTLWSAIDLAMRPLEPDDDVDPRWIPPATRHER
jgi:uncharacterized protein (DUF983 family)